MASFSPLQSIDFSRAETLITVISYVLEFGVSPGMEGIQMPVGCITETHREDQNSSRAGACESILAPVLQAMA